MTNIVERLRETRGILDNRWPGPTAMDLEAAAEIERLREALADIAVYGCGMLSQPPAMNGSEESWLRMRIAEYERRARNALERVAVSSTERETPNG